MSSLIFQNQHSEDQHMLDFFMLRAHALSNANAISELFSAIAEHYIRLQTSLFDDDSLYLDSIATLKDRINAYLPNLSKEHIDLINHEIEKTFSLYPFAAICIIESLVDVPYMEYNRKRAFFMSLLHKGLEQNNGTEFIDSICKCIKLILKDGHLGTSEIVRAEISRSYGWLRDEVTYQHIEYRSYAACQLLYILARSAPDITRIFFHADYFLTHCIWSGLRNEKNIARNAMSMTIEELIRQRVMSPDKLRKTLPMIERNLRAQTDAETRHGSLLLLTSFVRYERNPEFYNRVMDIVLDTHLYSDLHCRLTIIRLIPLIPTMTNLFLSCHLNKTVRDVYFVHTSKGDQATRACAFISMAEFIASVGRVAIAPFLDAMMDRVIAALDTKRMQFDGLDDREVRPHLFGSDKLRLTDSPVEMNRSPIPGSHKQGDVYKTMTPDSNLLYSRSPPSIDIEVQENDVVIEALKCLGAIAKVCDKSWLQPRIESLMDKLFANGLNSYLAEALQIVGESVPEFIPLFQERLLTSIARALMDGSSTPKSPRSEQATSPSKEGDRSPMKRRQSILDIPLRGSHRDDAESHLEISLSAMRLSPYELQLPGQQSEIIAMRTLATLNPLTNESIMTLLKTFVVPFLEHPKVEHRVVAVRTILRLTATYVGERSSADAEATDASEKSPKINVVKDIISHIVDCGVSDISDAVRHEVFSCLDNRIDPYLASPDYLETLFMGLYDEKLYIREATLGVLCRLAKIHPTYIVSGLTRIQEQFILELQHGRNLAQIHHCARMLLQIVCSEIVMNASSESIQNLQDLVLQKIQVIDVSHLSTTLLNLFHGIVQNTQLSGNETTCAADDAFPVLLSAIEDRNSCLQRRAALKALVSVIRSTATVGSPFYQLYPEFLNILLSALLNGENTIDFETRKEIMRVLGVIGAVDPVLIRTFIKSRKEYIEGHSHSAIDAFVAQTDVAARCSTPLHDSYPGAILKASIELMRNPSNALWAILMTSMSGVLRVLTPTQLGPHVSGLVDVFIETLQSDEYKAFHPDIVKHLHAVLVKGSQCGQRGCNSSAGRILRTIITYCERIDTEPSTSQNPGIILQIIILLEEIAKSFPIVVDAERQRWIFKFLVQKMIEDHTERKEISMKVISGLESFVSMLDRDMYYIVPLILHYIKPNILTANGININLRCLSFLTIAAQQHNFREVSARTIHHLIRLLEHTTSPEVQDRTMDVLCDMLVALGKLGNKFIFLVDSYSKAKHISNVRFSKILETYRKTNEIYEDRVIATETIRSDDEKSTASEIKETLSITIRGDYSVADFKSAMQNETGKEVAHIKVLSRECVKGATRIDFHFAAEMPSEAREKVFRIIDEKSSIFQNTIQFIENTQKPQLKVDVERILSFFSPQLYDALSEGEWNRWMDDLSTEFIRQSPEAAIRELLDISLHHPPMARELLPYSFFSVFQSLTRSQQQLIMDGLSKILLQNTTKDVMMRIVRLAEYLEPFRTTRTVRKEVGHPLETKSVVRSSLSEKFGIAYGESHAVGDPSKDSFYGKHKFRITKIARNTPGAKANIPVGSALLAIDDVEIQRISQIKECLEGKLKVDLHYQRQPRISYAHEISPYFDLFNLVHAARRAKYLTKALHYTELIYEQMSDEQAFHDFTFVNLLVDLYQQLNSPASAAGLLNRLFQSGKRMYSTESYENFFVGKLAQGKGKGAVYQKLQIFPKAIEYYTGQIQEEHTRGMMPNMDDVLGLCRCFTSVGNWSELVRVTKENWSLCNEAQKSELAAESAAAAWYLEDWHLMEESTDALQTEQADFFNAVLEIHKQNHDVAQNFIDSARCRLDSNLSILLGESYHRAYDHISMLQHLSELEEVIVYQTNADSRPFLRSLWDKRFKSVAHVPKILQVSLAIRSLVIPPEHDVHSWVKFVDITRNQDRPCMAEYGLSRLLRTAGTSSDLVSHEIDVQNCDIIVTLEYLKHIKQGNGEVAMRKLTELIEVLPDRQDVDCGTKSTCHFILAQWYHSNVENKFLLPSERAKRREKTVEHLNIARELDSKNFQAWHSWAIMNLQAGLHFIRQSPQESKEEGVLYLRSSLQGFFRSICLSRAGDGGNNTDVETDESREGHSDTDFQDILHVLYIWFNFGHIGTLCDEIAANIEDVAVAMWLKVIPQLISRIDHPNSTVREQLHRLLIKIGLEHPHALAYSLIVCATSTEESPRKRAAESILDAVHKVRPALIEEIRVLSNELVRVAMGWWERWMHALDKLLSKSYYETNSLKFFESYLLPLYTALEDPQTVEEQSFADMFANPLRRAWDLVHEAFRDGKNRRDIVQEALEMYRQVHRTIIEKMQDQPRVIPLRERSPILAERSFSIPMPGAYRDAADGTRSELYFSAFLPEVRVIQSKQRPHRIALRGEDGKVYKFLLKGNEDLRMDERVMQLFSLLNSFFSQSAAAQHTHHSIDPIMTYSVVPLSQDVGLIQWIERTETIYQLITKHRAARGSSTFLELNTLMQMGNLKNIKEFANLPHRQRQHLLQYVIDNTPDDDLKQIFWERNATSEDWLDYRTNFTRSTATMSIVGYLLGLGDRHLNNIMLNEKGRTVHIDFGDCFEVATLREWCPEKVPFRLTRMFVAAMESCGVNGMFQKVCENIMRVLRKNKDTIITLLETFAYDPLINWRLDASVESAECYSKPYAYVHNSKTQEDEHALIGNGTLRGTARPTDAPAAELSQAEQGSRVTEEDGSDSSGSEYEPTREDLPHHLSCTVSPTFARSTVKCSQYHETRKGDAATLIEETANMNLTARAALQRVRSKLVGTDFPMEPATRKAEDIDAEIASFQFSPDPAEYDAMGDRPSSRTKASKGMLHLPTSSLQAQSMPIFLSTAHMDANSPAFDGNHPYAGWTVLKEPNEYEDTQIFSTSLRNGPDDDIVSFQMSEYPRSSRLQEGSVTRRNVADQVQMLILEATAIENLCEAYIGWCPFW